MICVSISRRSQLMEMVRLGVPLVELRLDLMEEDPSVLYRDIPEEMKTVATCRSGKLEEAERIQWLNTSLDLGARYLDVDLESTGSGWDDLISKARAKGTDVIISFHDFSGTPVRQNLVRLYEKCLERDGDLVKMATVTNSVKELRDLISIHELPGRKVIVGMGTLGRISRVMGPYLGSEFTYAAPFRGEETASGQLTLEELNEIYHMLDAS